MTEPVDPGGVKSARRTITLLETVAARRDWMSLTDLRTATGFPRSSLHGLVRTLLDAGWLEADSAGNRVRLGVAALITGTGYLDRDPVVPRAARALERLRDASGHTTHFARLSGANVVYLETRQSPRAAPLISRVGRTLPAHTTALGKALLAEITEDEARRLLTDPLPSSTDRTVNSVDELVAELGAISAAGHAVERGEGTPEISCVAAVVPYRIPATDAISCALPTEIADAGEIGRVVDLVTATATELGRELRGAGIR